MADAPLKGVYVVEVYDKKQTPDDRQARATLAKGQGVAIDQLLALPSSIIRAA